MDVYTYPDPPPDRGVTFCKTVHTDTYPAIDPITKSNQSGNYVFVTGASKGIGRETAISFAKAGAAGIAIAARSDLLALESEILAAAKAAGKPAPKVLSLKVDVQDGESVKAAAKAIEETFGQLDILINNAGYLSEFSRMHEAEPTEWWLNYEINLHGVYWITSAVLPLMLKGGKKTIVNVASVGAISLSKGSSGYRVTKFALLRLTEAMCADYADQGLLAFSVHPGGVLTELASTMPKEMHKVLTDTAVLPADALCHLTSERRVWLAGRYLSCTWDMPEFLSREKEIVDGDKLKMRMRF